MKDVCTPPICPFSPLSLRLSGEMDKLGIKEQDGLEGQFLSAGAVITHDEFDGDWIGMAIYLVDPS